MDIGTEPTRFLFQVDVHDPVERNRLARVGVRGYRVVVKSPPGEGFTLNRKDARKLAAFIWEAANRADDDPDNPDYLGTIPFTTALAATTTATGAADNRRAGAAASQAPRPPVPTSTSPAEAS